MLRTFNITIAADTDPHQLYTMMLAQAGAIPTDGILPDRCSDLRIVAAIANAASTITVQDSNADGGQALFGGDHYERHSDRNTLCLRDYYLVGNALAFIVDVEYK